LTGAAASRGGRTIDAAALVAAARRARDGAYAPYSAYPVGAAALAADGEVFTGANVENASYGLSMCAERVAIFGAAVSGRRKVRAVAVVTESSKPAAPCGACRQVMAEFGVEVVYLAGPRGTPLRRRFRDLLPEAFTAADLTT
jgi:cytidine deaminase